ncbi:short-chain dehydrogenase/reductase SDR [Tepidicaulis marinus]|uniref:Short-chain dehydrogenase/reductase SDR n=1 Tax=Tepidicaulis marinus TaxID=1333998 RepID=A0A081BBR9_9HYPH|nr:glucose 1-dehydrogenase [Tepidicaulis marinus]GAK45487.1 short-chain dehydrogenase/reductase SDR [Tepidicaulis marinus]
MGRLEGKIALVTGASSGIGRGAAEALAAEGAQVIITDIDDEGGAETVERIQKAGGKARYLNQDVVSEPRWQEVYADIAAKEGKLHILVNNAGIGIGGPVTEMSLDDWKRQIAINMDGVFLGTKYGIPAIAEAGGGAIINISSVAGFKGAPGLAGYCATKGGVRLFTKAVALECAEAKNNIRVNSIHPGIIDTAIWAKIPQGGMPSSMAMQEGANTIDAEALGQLAAPVGYAGVPADIAAGIVFLASDESRYVTGTELVIDGGMCAR